MPVARIAVGGMTCGACTSAVTTALENIEGVHSVNVSLTTELATVDFTGRADALVAAVEDAGFDAELVKIESQTRRFELLIGGMTCTNCSTSVTNALSAVAGVQSASVSLATDTADVVYNGSDPQLLVSAVEDAGFDAEIVKTASLETKEVKTSISALELKIFGINTPDDEHKVRDLLANIDGVTYAEVTDANTLIRFDNTVTGVRRIFSVLENSGFRALVAVTADNSRQVAALNRVKELQMYYHDLVIAFSFGVPLILVSKLRSYLPKFLTAYIGRGVWVDDLVAIALVIPIMVGPARRFITKTLHSLRTGALTMDALVTTSVVSGVSFSIIAFIHALVVDLQHHHGYLWDACAMILMFVLLGKYLENMARGQTSQALAGLISLVPEEATVIAPDTDMTEGKKLHTDMLQVGDVILLHSGERLSADGVVIEGESFVNEAMLTGESKPVKKTVGDQVIGGTINGLGVLKFRVTTCGSDTKLAQIIAFIKNAQSTRAPIQRYADMMSAKFVPIVLSLALITFLGWLAAGLILGTDRLPSMFHHDSLIFTCTKLGIAVVVVACPCALGLATPTAVMVATTVGANNGILVKGGNVFETGSAVSTVLFDKTGTLTTGKMSVTRNTVPSKYWPLVHALESVSEHPSGKALANFEHPESVSAEKVEVSEVTVHPGEGISGIFGSNKMFVGRREHDRSIVVVFDNEIVGEIDLRDSIRSDSFAVVERLQSRGLKVGILSGDSALAVEQVATDLGIDPQFTWSGLRPENKVEIVDQMKSQGEVVAFVGDGINDSAALVSASVGMSLEGSTHVAVESADVVLTQVSPVSGVPDALDLCHVAMRRIKLNLLSSVLYNAVMIPFAMGLLLPFGLMLSPIMASASMAMSSVSVVVSSLMLKTWRPESQPRRDWRSYLPNWFRGREIAYQSV